MQESKRTVLVGANSMKTGRFARRGRVDRSKGWNVGELDQMALPPCHKHYQVFVSGDWKLRGIVSTVRRWVCRLAMERVFRSPSDPSTGEGNGARTRRGRLVRNGCAPVSEPHRASQRATPSGAEAVSGAEDQEKGRVAVRLPDRRLRTRRIRPPPADLIADSSLTWKRRNPRHTRRVRRARRAVCAAIYRNSMTAAGSICTAEQSHEHGWKTNSCWGATRCRRKREPHPRWRQGAVRGVAPSRLSHDCRPVLLDVLARPCHQFGKDFDRAHRCPFPKNVTGKYRVVALGRVYLLPGEDVADLDGESLGSSKIALLVEAQQQRVALPRLFREHCSVNSLDFLVRRRVVHVLSPELGQIRPAEASGAPRRTSGDLVHRTLTVAFSIVSAVVEIHDATDAGGLLSPAVEGEYRAQVRAPWRAGHLHGRPGLAEALRPPRREGNRFRGAHDDENSRGSRGTRFAVHRRAHRCAIDPRHGRSAAARRTLPGGGGGRHLHRNRSSNTSAARSRRSTWRACSKAARPRS